MLRSLFAMLLVFLAGCDGLQVEPVDVRGQPIVGHWYYEGVTRENSQVNAIHAYLHIRPDGFAAYAFQVCRSEASDEPTSSNLTSQSQLILDYMPIKRLNIKQMVLQNYPLTPSFQLTLGQWPDQGDGRFEVDETILSPISASEVPDYHRWSCE